MVVSGWDDSELYIGAFSDVCNKCRYLLDGGFKRKCKAFDEIPLEIWKGKNRHRKPYPGDNGIQFEPVKE